MLHLLLGKDWTANRDVILSRIAEDVRNGEGGRILIVPELISHEMERQLCSYAGDTASRYAEVLSFTRLYRRVSDSMGSAAIECLDDGGRVVAMASAARQLASRLKAYAAVETKPEFLTDLIDAVDEFKRCCITSEQLMQASGETQGSLAQKLEELSLLMESYDTLCSRGKRDPRDQMTWLLEQLEDGSFGEEHVFYIDGFPDFTRQNLAVIEHLITVSADVTVSLNCDRVDSVQFAFEKAGETASELIRCAHRAGVEVHIETVPVPESPLNSVKEKLFQGLMKDSCGHGVLFSNRLDSPWQECMYAAGKIRDLIQSGCRYRDISLVCTDMTVYQPLVNLVFHRFGIPVYQSGTEDILQKSVISTVLTALDAALSGFEQKNTLRYLRSSLSPLTPDVCDLVENYAIMWGVRGQGWNTDWEYHPDGLGQEWTEQAKMMLCLLNEARDLAITPLTHLQRRFREAKNLSDQVMATYLFLEEIRLGQRLSHMARQMDEAGDNRGAQILNQLWEILISALEQLYDVLGETHWDTEHFVRLLRLLLSQYTVGTIPPVLDAVHMGPVSAMRCNHQKHLIVLGAQEGSLPGYSGSKGVLTDQERVTLRELGVTLTGGAMQGIQAEFAEIYGVFCGAEETISICCGSEQPSYIFRRLEIMAGEQHSFNDDMGYALADQFEAGAWLSGLNNEAAAQRLNILDDYREICRRRDYTLGKVERKHIQALYGKTLNLSASQIDRQAECRLSYFLKYGLRAKERKEITVDPAEFGTYVHAVLENTARCIRDMGGFQNVSVEQTLEIAHRFSDDYAKERFSQIASDRMSYLFRRNMHELDMVVRELWAELQQSSFEPREFELNFGSPEGLDPIVIPNSKMNALLRGFVDRVDIWYNGNCSYYRVVDYKTGKKDFDYCDVFNGVGLQLLLYLFALKNSGADLLGEWPIPAGVQYFPARAPYLPSDGKLTEEQAEELRALQWKRKGLLLQDTAVLKAMEPTDTPVRMNYTVKKDGSLSGDLADRDQLKLLEGYIMKTLASMVEDIASGDVQPNPYTRGTSHSACDYCPYSTVCHKNSVKGRRNYKTMTAQRFWEEIGKEMSDGSR